MLSKNILLPAFCALLVFGFNIDGMDQIIIEGTVVINDAALEPMYMRSQQTIASQAKESHPHYSLCHSCKVFDNTQRHGRLLTVVQIPTEKLFGCNNGSFVKINKTNSYDASFEYRLTCQANPLVPGKDFAEQFTCSIDNFFIKNPYATNNEEAIGIGLITPNGGHGPNSCSNEAAFRQKMINARSNSTLARTGSNLTSSLLNRQLPGHFRNELDKQNMQAMQDIKNAQDKVRFMMENPGHNSQRPAKGSSRGGCIIL